MDRKREISQNLERVESEIADVLARVGRSRSEVTLIAVTKNFPASDIDILYQLGVRDFGENRDQEAREKIPLVEANNKTDGDIRWHFQGQLQRNKLASIGSWADMVHSVDDAKYLPGLSAAALKNGRVVTCLIQISLDEDPAPGRGGTSPTGALEIISSYEQERSALAGVNISGVMGVAPLETPAEKAFSKLFEVFSQLRTSYPPLTILSAGMSGDYVEALAAGATHVRIGSSILGSRKFDR